MAISITAFTPNTQIKSSEVNTNFTNIKNGVVDSSYRAFAWGIIGTLIVSDEQGMKYIVPSNVTCLKLWARTSSGTATIRVQKDTTDVLSTFDVDSTVGSETTFDSGALTAGEVLTLDVTAASGTDLYVTLETQVTTIV